MKKVFVSFFVFLASVSVFASGGSQGTYSNGRPECELQISVSDFLGTGREMFVAGVSQNKITPWGANFNIEMDTVDQYGICPKTLIIDDLMGGGYGGNNAITLKFDDTFCEVTEFRIRNSQNKSLYCPSMRKVK